MLGVDKKTKQLQLISEDFVPLTGGGDRGNRIGQYYYLDGQAGYANGVDELNRICSIYATGIGATSARIVNIEDIDWITGYNPNNTGKKDPNKTGSGTKHQANQINEYGDNVKYTFTGTNVKYEPTNGVASGIGNYMQFTYYDEAVKTWNSLAKSGSVMLRSSSYYYYPTTLTSTDDKTATVGIGVNTPEYKMMFTNSSTGADKVNSGKTDNIYYWLGSPFVATSTGLAGFGLRHVKLGNVNYCRLYGSYGSTSTFYCGVRPVVNLDFKVTLKDSGKLQDGCKLYNMSLDK